MEDEKPAEAPVAKGETRVVVNLWPVFKWIYRKLTGKKIKDDI
jgi:hypothetical protein